MYSAVDVLDVYDERCLAGNGVGKVELLNDPKVHLRSVTSTSCVHTRVENLSNVRFVL